jgi:hypothetical protein
MEQWTGVSHTHRRTTQRATTRHPPTSAAAFVQKINLSRFLPCPGFCRFFVHPLKGKPEGRWAVDVDENFRVVFRFEDDHATEVDYGDYH